MRALAVAAFLALILVSACEGPLSPGQGRVTGLVGGAPTSPLGNEIGPAPGKTVLFVPIAGGPTRSTTTGRDGRYTIDLAQGDYEVRLKGFAPLQLYYSRTQATYGKWPHVTVIPGREIKLDLIYDTGIR